ncbi:hypothetical protein RRG08_051392 [Elysia crispata]|uniref:Uncharacterized protein n=1 Tax=Elysia crispata TaxID=231223 RepID=A0AAE1B3X8_9GAST|nr:hypothetical protein RRG08_051392 [Elysia crispata]
MRPTSPPAAPNSLPLFSFTSHMLYVYPGHTETLANSFTLALSKARLSGNDDASVPQCLKWSSNRMGWHSNTITSPVLWDVAILII